MKRVRFSRLGSLSEGDLIVDPDFRGKEQRRGGTSRIAIDSA